MVKKLWRIIKGKLGYLVDSGGGKDDPFEIVSSLMGPRPVILDGGACEGESIKKMKRKFENPYIYAVEPLPSHVETLRSKYNKDKDVKIIPVALGEEDKKIKINKTKKSNSSSVYKPSNTLISHRKEENRDNYHIEERIRVDQNRIDDIVDKKVDIIKLDLQGYELNALKGAIKSLKKCSIVIAEVEFIRYYEGQPLFRNIDELLHKNGFRFYRFGKIREESDGTMSTSDAIYINKNRKICNISISKKT